MLNRTPILALLALASLPASAVDAATPPAQRNYSVTSFDRIRIDGPYKVELRTNVSPYARATGAPLALDGLSVSVEGRTLIVRRGSGGWGGYASEGRGPVTIELGTPDLKTAWVNGAGALNIDRVRGLGFELSINGPGSARIDAVEVDQMKIAASGAATARLSGSAKKLTAVIRGTSTLEADGLRTNDASIGAEGPAVVRASVSNSAKVHASGLASVTLTGNPACETKALGSAIVSGCKDGGRN